MDLSKFEYSDEIILFLSEILDKQPSSLFKAIKGKSAGYKEISRNINLQEKELLQGKKIKGLYFKENLRRAYPEKDVVSHVVGLTDIDRKGIQGTELVFHREL